MEVIKSNSFFCVFASTLATKHSTLKPSCVFCSHNSSRKENEFVQQNLHKHSYVPPSPSPTVYIRFILNYFLWPFAIIKKLFVYSVRLFLLLIDFLLHIMGIQNRMKSKVEMWSAFE